MRTGNGVVSRCSIALFSEEPGNEAGQCSTRTWYSIAIVYNDMHVVVYDSRLATAIVWMGFNCSVDFLPDAKCLKVVDKSASAVIPAEAA